MKALRENLSLTLAKLRIETEKLEREDEVMRVQEGKLRESYKQLEETQLRYRAKGDDFLLPFFASMLTNTQFKVYWTRPREC